MEVSHSYSPYLSLELPSLFWEHRQSPIHVHNYHPYNLQKPLVKLNECWQIRNWDCSLLFFSVCTSLVFAWLVIQQDLRAWEAWVLCILSFSLARLSSTERFGSLILSLMTQSKVSWSSAYILLTICPCLSLRLFASFQIIQPLVGFPHTSLTSEWCQAFIIQYLAQDPTQIHPSFTTLLFTVHLYPIIIYSFSQ